MQEEVDDADEIARLLPREEESAGEREDLEVLMMLTDV